MAVHLNHSAWRIKPPPGNLVPLLENETAKVRLNVYNCRPFPLSWHLFLAQVKIMGFKPNFPPVSRVSNKAIHSTQLMLSSTCMNPIDTIHTAIAPLRQALQHHPVHRQITTLADLNIFMEHDIFVVWDFMSLLKALQRELTCVDVPWVPRGSPVVRKLINEIVLEVESGLDQDGRPASHYELYLDAMEATGADTGPIKDLIREISFGKTVSQALWCLPVAEAVKNLVGFTFDTIAGSKVHEMAAIFTCGQKDLISAQLCSQVEDLEETTPNQLSHLLYYLDHHFDLEAGDYRVMVMQMMMELCGEDDTKWAECQAAARRALQYRVALWDQVLACIHQRRQELGPPILADNGDYTNY
jgi:hypothetical protein